MTRAITTLLVALTCVAPLAQTDGWVSLFDGHLGFGTFALQGHDPKSKVFYKNIMVTVLPN